MRLRNRNALMLFAAGLAAALGVTCRSGERKSQPASSELKMPPEPMRPDAKLVFSHKLHVEAEVACADCHGKPQSIELPSERGERLNCSGCHDEVGERDKPGEGCAMCHKAADFSVDWPQSPRTPGLIFSHGKHADIECSDCHAGYEKLEGPLGKVPSSMESCQDCHDDPKEYGCAFCHSNLDRLRPVSHGALNWKPAHGPFGRSGKLANTRNDCSGCHGEDVCVECHAKRKPEDHSDDFPGKGHCAAARDNPGRCEVCHGKASCRACHAKSKPADHNPAFAHTGHCSAVRHDMRRCGVCHERSYCDSCHAQNPPKDHTNHFRQAGHGFALSADRERCMACHMTDFCVRCHSSTSPRSHTAGWNNPRNRHCENCHWPAGSGSHNCGMCHKSFPGHAAQAPLSAAHASRSSNCALCHQGMHPVNDNACTDCHTP